MNELRRALLDSTDGPPELSPDLRFLAARQASLAALMLDHAQRYKVLYTAARESGTTEEIQTAALDAAGNLGTLLQSLRSREDLQVALAHAPGYTPTPLLAVDQLFFSFTLLAGVGGELAGVNGDRIALLAGVSGDRIEELDAALAPEGVDELFGSERVREWLHGLGVLAPGK